MSWAVWITGLPGSGKSVIAATVAEMLEAWDCRVVVLELDQIRRVITPHPTYTDAEREAVYRALVHIGAGLVDAGTPVIFDATAHRRAWRDLARAAIKKFAEVQLICPLAVCREREASRVGTGAPRGIYAGSGRPGSRVPGVDVTYEPARAPELMLDTKDQSVEASARAIVGMVTTRFLHAGRREEGHIRAAGGAGRSAILLDDGTPEQNEISRRAREYLAERLRGATR
jgi:adenylylsulfate kinase